MNAKRLKQQKRTPPRKLFSNLPTPRRADLFSWQTQRRRCFYKPVATLERSFCTCESKRKENDSQIYAASACVWVNYASELYMNYRRTICELCRTNWIDEPHLCKEYKGLLGANYANRARLVSVGKLSRKTMGRAELSAKSKHNITSFSKIRERPYP